MTEEQVGKTQAAPASTFESLEANVIKGAPGMDDERIKAITLLMPHLINSAHVLLRSHGVNAVVHRITFRPTDAVADLSAMNDSLSCCLDAYGNLLCPCPD